MEGLPLSELVCILALDMEHINLRCCEMKRESLPAPRFSPYGGEGRASRRA
jgi:hypothetical protein